MLTRTVMVPFGMMVASENPLPATTNCSFPSKSSSFAAYKIGMLHFILVNDWALTLNLMKTSLVFEVKIVIAIQKAVCMVHRGSIKCLHSARHFVKQFPIMSVLLFTIMLTSMWTKINLKTTLCQIRYNFIFLENHLFHFAFFQQTAHVI